MPRKGQAHATNDEWKKRVRDRIEELKRAGKIKSQNDLADQAGIAHSSLSESLAPEARQSSVMPELHKALGWPPPLVAPPNHILQFVHDFMQLDKVTQGQWTERARQALEESKQRNNKKKR